ncbi:MAG: metallophosphoesterase family protein [Desulfobacteraceae bacterium]|nr:metallophosphoesterase family protein [Desulfobacteraceae bacterium]
MTGFLRIKNHMILAGLCLLLWAGRGLAGDAALPERIILNLTETPFSSQAVTWRTREKGLSPRAEIIPVSDLLNPEIRPGAFPALSTPVALDDKTGVFQHSVVFSGLLPGTVYAYRVGEDPAWSEWNQFKTAQDQPEPFTFLYFGDVQEEVFSMCSQVFRVAFQKEPEARFWLFAGDMVDNGPDDRLWGDFFSALGWISRTTPLVPAAGNHEYPDPRKTPADQRRITSLWRPQFTLPENGPAGLEETVFRFDYQGLRVVVLNGNEKIPEQALWLEGVLSQNPQVWTIVVIHQPVYPISQRKTQTDFQDLLVPVFDRHSVDLVLQGHDHGYARTVSLKNHQPVSEKEKGVVYIISNSGPKFYPPGDRYDHLMAKTLSRTISFQSVRVKNNTLQYRAYTLAKETMDAFEIKK